MLSSYQPILPWPVAAEAGGGVAGALVDAAVAVPLAAVAGAGRVAGASAPPVVLVAAPGLVEGCASDWAAACLALSPSRVAYRAITMIAPANSATTQLNRRQFTRVS
jgi:hypothetical protein